ncbi:ommochrome-binding protein-like [Helicoverpa zea]|uniref:ommochrome-binding protein-like n=1 Tax=Helicoverpa zea TaxID=7113 RepID=UPI001F5739F9|nr:ommochrome-binding protein-like [Helicoverpa zea]
MKLVILLCLCGLISTQAGVVKEGNECTGVTINGVYYDAETLREGLDRPYLLAVDYSTNNLYFSYNVKENEDFFKSARLNLNTKEFHNIEDISNGFAQTVDQVTHDVYIGGSDGIYKYNFGENKAELIGEKGSNIWSLYFKDVLYYSVFPAQFLYILEDGQGRRFVDLEDTKVDQFVIDNQDDIFFSNATGLFSQKKGTKDAVLYLESPVLRSLTTDKNGNAYACLQDGIYTIKKSSTSLEKVLEVDDAFGLAFDVDNNIVYSDATRLVRLKVNKHKKC